MKRVRLNRPRNKPTPNILDACHDPKLFAPWFERTGDSWGAWFTFLKALFALPMSQTDLALYRQCTGRQQPPKQVASEGWLICGRRAGKSFLLGLVAVFLACFQDYRKYLAKGERGTILVIAVDRRQARTVLRFIRALLTQVPMLARMVEREASDAFDLKNQTTIEVHTASFRTTRGYTIVAALLDELAFWRGEESSDPDTEIINAIKPGMATIPGSMLLGASSPYARRGALYEAHKQHFGKDGDPVLVWQAATRLMNSTVPQSIIDQAMQADPASASAEYLALFRTDVEGFVSREAVKACVASGLYERPPQNGLRYCAFVDPSGGSADSFTLGIAHRDREQLLLDCLREVRPPFSPESVVSELAKALKAYHVYKVSGDRYGGEWPREQFRKHGINYEPAAKTKSDLYRDLLPLLNSRRVELLDNARLVHQLVSLERRTSRAGKDSIDHPPGQHDDLCNAAAGAVLAANADANRPRIRVISDGAYCNGVSHQIWPPPLAPMSILSGGHPHHACIPGKGFTQSTKTSDWHPAAREKF